MDTSMLVDDTSNPLGMLRKRARAEFDGAARRLSFVASAADPRAAILAAMREEGGDEFYGTVSSAALGGDSSGGGDAAADAAVDLTKPVATEDSVLQSMFDTILSATAAQYQSLLDMAKSYRFVSPYHERAADAIISGLDASRAALQPALDSITAFRDGVAHPEKLGATLPDQLLRAVIMIAETCGLIMDCWGKSNEVYKSAHAMIVHLAGEVPSVPLPRVTVTGMDTDAAPAPTEAAASAAAAPASAAAAAAAALVVMGRPPTPVVPPPLPFATQEEPDVDLS